MIRRLVLTTVLLGLFSVCRGQEDAKPSACMPKGKLADTLFTAVSRIIEEERMFEYESHYGLPPELEQRMLDGFRWRFDACFENGERIHSSGRHVFPDGNGLQKIERLLYHAAEAATKATPDEE